MGVTGTTQVRLHSPRAEEATVTSWSLPAFVSPMRSSTIMRATGDDLVLLQPRVASALNIENNDRVQIDLTEVGESFTLTVKILESLTSDVLIHDLFALGIAKRFTFDGRDCTVTLQSGRELALQTQEMWAGIRIAVSKGSASLCFGGAGSSNPNGPSGYGFRITKGENTGSDTSGEELVRGFGHGTHRSKSEVEYQGLIEGIIWAKRLDLQSLCVYGDSELTIRQVRGKEKVLEPRLQALHLLVERLLCRYSRLTCVFSHVPQEENQAANCLANCGVGTRENMTLCNWTNINRLMYCHINT